MADNKDILSKSTSKLKLANNYLKDGIFDKAKDKFKELESYEECSKLVKFALLLCDLKITDIKVAHTQKFYKYICDLAIKRNDVRLYLESFKLLEMLSGEDFIGDIFVEGILDKFDLCNTMSFEELKNFIDDYKDSYLYLNLLNEAASDYFARKKFEQGFYFVESALKISDDNEIARFNLLLYKTKSSNIKELISIETPLYELKEFEELCELNEEAYYPLIEKQKYEKQRKIDEKIRKEEQAKLDAKKKAEKFWEGIGNFFGGIGEFFCNCGEGIGDFLGGFGEFFCNCGEGIGDFLGGFGECLGGFFVGLWKVILAILPFLPIALSILFAAILFMNQLQINILSNYEIWYGLFMVFAAFSIIATMIHIPHIANGEYSYDEKPGFYYVSAVITVIVAIIGTIGSCHLQWDFNPCNFIQLTCTNKSPIDNNTCRLSFDLKNVGNTDVSYIYGHMIFYNNSTIIGKWWVTLQGYYGSGSSHDITVDFDDAASTNLCGTDYYSLGIDFNISEMRFNGDYDTYSFEGDYIRIK